MGLDNLYRTVIMDHYKNPKNKGFVPDDSYYKVHLNNPSCGDDITIQLKLENGIVKDIRHEGKGCSICCSSASVMSETLKGLTVEEALKVIHEFYELVQGHEISDPDALQEAVVYQGVSSFPARIKCATLSWKAVEKGIEEGTPNE